jgi:hypothetical protein
MFIDLDDTKGQVQGLPLYLTLYEKYIKQESLQAFKNVNLSCAFF